MRDKNQFVVVSLDRHIKLHHGGNKAAFGRSIGKSGQVINNWVNEGRVIGGGTIFAPKLDIE